MAFTPLPAKNARVTVGAGPTIVYADVAEVTETGGDLDTTNFESSGYSEGIIGVSECTWTVRGVYDAGQVPYTDPPGFYPRNDMASLKILASRTANALYTFTLARCLSARVSANVRERVNIEASGKNQSTFTRPSA